MRLLITRPEPDNERTAAQLRACGHDVLLAPLMQMKPVAADLADGPWHAVALTSVNALRAAAAHPQLASLLATPLYAVGGRTADAALELGFDNVISADGDVSDLARVMKVHLRPGARVLYLAGEERAGNLGGALAAAGIAVTTAVIYRGTAVLKFPTAARDAIAAGQLDGVLHFSQHSAVIYIACASIAGLQAAAFAPAHYCLSPRVAEPLVKAGATAIRIAERPTEADLLRMIEA